MANLARLLASDGRAREAEDLYAGVLEKRKKVFGPEHPDTIRAMADLGGVLGLEKKYAEAEKVGREALEIGRRVLGEKDPTMAILLYNLGAVASLGGRIDEAITLLNQAIDAGLPPGVADNIERDPDLTPLKRPVSGTGGSRTRSSQGEQQGGIVAQAADLESAGAVTGRLKTAGRGLTLYRCRRPLSFRP